MDDNTLVYRFTFVYPLFQFIEISWQPVWLSDCPYCTSTRALKLQRFCPFTLNGVTSHFAELHCGSVASVCSQCSLQKLSNVQLLKLRRKRQPIKSYASTSSSQSNRVLVCPGREIHVIGCWSSFRHARRQASTHAAVWALRYCLLFHWTLCTPICWCCRVPRCQQLS